MRIQENTAESIVWETVLPLKTLISVFILFSLWPRYQKEEAL